ncbi:MULTISPECIES: MMPL family transporter [unclassified Pseudoalteromonas]|uniref:efflux RND transporter permease subunit n=1 Tax=unclassified Pseudoalteromonas TaxID=194690 RepID=UPI00209843DE|nr:MMPL family transporter [Pseudoalteromonas sp. XMcav2-N]MCO7186829.1 MMPL family transporter [Pseudoalteromonas sp. XMcav2-N]
MKDKLFGFVGKHPFWVILVSLTLAFLAASGAQNLVFKSDYRVFFGKDNPQLVAYESMQNIYSKSDNVSFVVVPKDGNVFTAQHLQSLKELTKQSWQIPYSTRVDSVTNFQYTYAEEDDLIVEDLVGDTRALSQADLDKIKSIATREPLLVNKIVSPQGHVSVVNVSIQFPGIDLNAEVPEVSAFVKNMTDAFLANNPGVEVHLSGMVMMNGAFTDVAMSDSATLVPLMFLIVIVFIGVLLRTISGTFATVVVIILSISATMGIAGWMGIFLTGPSSSAPTMILTLAVADCIHILSSMFYEMRRGVDKKTAIARSLRLNFQPILLTSVTTAIGFLSMNFSDSPPFHDLGNMVAIGVMLAFVFAITIFPALLSVLPIKVKQVSTKKHDKMEKLAEFVIKKRRLLLPVTSAIIIASALFIPKNELNDDFVKYFDTSVPYRVATDFMQTHLSGMTLLEISVQTNESSGINKPEYLRTVSDFSDWLRDQPETDHVNTITDTLKRLNKNMHGDDPAWYKLPTDQEMAAQYLLLYEMSLPYGLDLNNQLNVDKSSSKIVGTFKNMTSNELIALETKIQDWFGAHAAQYKVDIASPSLMFAHIGQRSINSMLLGTVLALLLISVILGVALKSWRFGAISLLPNLIPAGVAFGIWGLSVGQVGMSISVVIGMTLGIVVDDTVHFLSKYLHARREQKADTHTAVKYAFGHVGTALWTTTFVLVAGFIVLAQSSFSLNADMGLMTAITIFVALVVDFLFLPPLLMMLDKRKNTQSSAQSEETQQTDTPLANTTG